MTGCCLNVTCLRGSWHVQAQAMPQEETRSLIEQKGFAINVPDQVDVSVQQFWYVLSMPLKERQR